MKRAISILEKLAPLKIAAEWDNVGLIVGDASAPLKGIVVSLDLTEDAIKKAVEVKANLIVVHHPPIFSPIKKIDTGSPFGKIIKSLLKNDISVYAMHTNLDSAPKGLNDFVAKMLGLKSVKAVKGGEITYRIGQLPKKVSSLKFARQIKKTLGVNSVRHFGPEKEVKSIAICTGSGAGILSDALKAGAELLVTGDVKHHSGIESHALDIPVVDAGHAGTENPMTILVSDYLKKNLTKSQKRVRITPFPTRENFMEV